MPPLPISRSALDALGKRLRAGSVADADWVTLESVLDEYQDALDVVQQRLTELGLASTTRVKSTGTLIEKLDRGTSFKSVQDVAGARIVVAGGCPEQDRVVSTIVETFGTHSRVIDRRVNPSHGYRAVHVVVHESDLPVEIQVRTEPQDLWAQTMERLADRWGRGLRYGEPLAGADAEIVPGVTKGDLVDLLFSMGVSIATYEQIQRGSIEDDVAFAEVEAATQSMLAAMTGLFTQLDDLLG